MKKYAIALLFASVALSGCSTGNSSGYFSGQKDAYLKARPAERIKVPAGMVANGMRDNFPVPTRHYSQEEANVELEPPKV